MAKKLNHFYPNENNYVDLNGMDSGGKKPPKKKKSQVWNKLRPLVIFVISLAVVVLIVFNAVSYVREHYFDPVDKENSNAVEVTIPKGSSLNKISDILYENDLIRNKQVFKLYVDFSDMASKLKAGTYELSKNMTFDDLIYALQEGKNDSNVAKATFKEGFTLEDFGDVLVEKGILKNTIRYKELATSGEAFAADYDFISSVIAENAAKEEGQKRNYVLEGYLFPDTYEYFTDASEEEIIKKQLSQFNAVFKDEYKARAQELGMSVDQIVTLASIIEKEARRSEDFSKVAAVFYNRLSDPDYGYLDSDATQAYALGIKGVYELGDKKTVATPYNTFRNGVGLPGLPAGPIGNPGKAAIEAALYPNEELMQDGEKYFYFVVSNTESGELEFNKTLEEHNAAVAKYKAMWDQSDQAAQGN